MDLVGRKLMDGGEAAKALLAEVEASAFAAANDALGAKVSAAASQVAEATDWMLNAETLNDVVSLAPCHICAPGAFCWVVITC